jgi:cell division protein FtsI/penicillin-binding protein 2
MKPIVNPNIQYLEDIKRIPIGNSVLLTPHISGCKLVFEAWSALNKLYKGELILESGHRKKLKDRTPPQHHPHHFRNQTTKRPTDTPPHTQKHDVQQIIYIKRRQTGNCEWGMPLATGKPKWEAVYHHPILSKDGDVAWRMITPQQLHKWATRDTSDCPWCPGTTGTIDHIPFEWPTVTAFWGRLTKTLHDLLGPHPLQKRHILYGYTTLDTTPHQLANYLLVLVKTTIYKTHLATNTPNQQPPDYQRHVPNEAAIPTTPRNAPQHMATRHRDLHELLATWNHPRKDSRWKNCTERPDLDTAVYTNYIRRRMQYIITYLYFTSKKILNNLLLTHC